MADRLDFQLLSAGLRRMGWIRFWIQLTLGVVVMGILLTQKIGDSFKQNSEQVLEPGLGAAISVTTLAFFVLLYSLWQGWLIVRLGRAISSDVRPSRGEASRLLKRGVLVDLLGLVLAVVGYESYAGGLFFQTARQQPGLSIGAGMDNYTITSLEMLSVLSNTQVLFAHFVGLLFSLWLLQRIYRTN